MASEQRIDAVVYDEDYDGPWLSGLVSCEFCAKRWIAVRSVGTERLECPKCGRMSEDPAGRHMIDAG